MKIEPTTLQRLRDDLLQSGRRPSMVLPAIYEVLTREGKLSPEETMSIARVEPLAETMFLMMAADGVIAEEERDVVRGAIRGLSNEQIRSGTINVMLEGFQARLEAEGRDARLKEIAEALSEDVKEAETAFTLAAAVAFADDDITDEENELINQVASWFGLSEERAEQVLDQLQEEQGED